MKLRNRPEGRGGEKSGCRAMKRHMGRPRTAYLAARGHPHHTSMQLQAAFSPTPHQPVHPSALRQRTNARGGGQHD